MTKDQAIARFVKAVKLDRHDWEDWPKDSREAFLALQQPPAPDCRTCVTFSACKWYHGSIDNPANCTNGDKYQPSPAVVLWRTEP